MEQEIAQITIVYNLITDFLVNYSFQLIGAIVIFLAGFWLAVKLSNWVLDFCQGKGLDVTLSKFLASATRVIIIALVAIICLGKLGISITPLVAAIGALSLGAGLALQGLLSNYGAGFNIILSRTFVVGDTIEVQGVRGIVTDIHLAYTELMDEDQVKITIPNKHIVGEIIHNSQQDSLQELVIGISYDDDPFKAIEVIKESLSAVANISKSRDYVIGIDQFADSAIEIKLRLWVDSRFIHQFRFAANEAIYSALRQANINIPYPQRDVHLISSQVDKPTSGS
jgi:small conductance mechanosensitive channel